MVLVMLLVMFFVMVLVMPLVMVLVMPLYKPSGVKVLIFSFFILLFRCSIVLLFERTQCATLKTLDSRLKHAGMTGFFFHVAPWCFCRAQWRCG